jgi:hypothetical protein
MLVNKTQLLNGEKQKLRTRPRVPSIPDQVAQRFHIDDSIDLRQSYLAQQCLCFEHRG